MNHRKKLAAIVFAGLLLLPAATWAAHPLITDDTGTQGQGRFQFELNGQYDREDENGTTETGGQANATVTYGIIDTVDVAIGIPFLWLDETSDVFHTAENGFSDLAVDVKWRFFENEGFSLALKPGITFPTGDDQKGLGAGYAGGHLYLIGSLEAGPWAFHANLGYIYNNNTLDQEQNLWHASFATTWEVVNDLKIVADIGAEKNADKDADNDPAFILGGLIYSVNSLLDVDCGVKYGLTSSETDWSWMAGLTFRF
jgi:hypothetical protein